MENVIIQLYFQSLFYMEGFLVAQLVKNLPAMQRPGFVSWIGKIPWRRKWQPIPVMGFSVQFSLVTQSCLTLCDPMNYSTPGFLSITNSQSLLKLKYIKLVIPSNHLIFCVPFSPHLQSFPASGSFQMSQFFASSG